MATLNIRYFISRNYNPDNYMINFGKANEKEPFTFFGVNRTFTIGPLDGPNDVFPTTEDAALYYFNNGDGQTIINDYNTTFGTSFTLGSLIYHMEDAYDSRFKALESSMPSARSFNNPTVTLNTAGQVSTTRDAMVSYSVDVSTSLSLAGGAFGTVYLEYADDSGFTTNVKEIGRSVNGNTGALTIGLSLAQTNTATLSGVIPAGKYRRLRTQNNTGTPTFTFRSSQETLL